MRARLLYMNEVRLKEVTDSSARRRDDFVPRPEGGSPFVGYRSGPSRRPPAYDREEDEQFPMPAARPLVPPPYHPSTAPRPPSADRIQAPAVPPPSYQPQN
ncbi:hypothetical protein ONZ45_g12391 [Pleurotus djamor]|nr:hypothetical protein ONZ45_g12391 [Pleurotus djamor]